MPYYPFYTYPYTPPVVPQNTPQAAQPLNSPTDINRPLNGANNAFINVRSIDEAKNYPVAPGNSFTFKVENSPFLCTKTMGFSQLEQPQFEKYRLVKEEEEEPPAVEYALKTDIDGIKKRLADIESKLEGGV